MEQYSDRWKGDPYRRDAAKMRRDNEAIAAEEAAIRRARSSGGGGGSSNKGCLIVSAVSLGGLLVTGLAAKTGIEHIVDPSSPKASVTEKKFIPQPPQERKIELKQDVFTQVNK
jgi:hypothetical protein